MTLDYAELLKGFSPDTDPADLVASLRLGLTKQHPAGVVDSALGITFARMARGKSFDSVREVHRYANKECHKQAIARERALLRLTQTNQNKLLAVAKDGAGWGIIATWTVLGFLSGALSVWLLTI